MRADRPDPSEDRHVPGVVEHLREGHRLGEPAPGRVEADHEGRVAPAAGLVDCLLEIVHRGTVDRTIDDGQEDPRPLGSGRW